MKNILLNSDKSHLDHQSADSAVFDKVSTAIRIRLPINGQESSD